jgi:hypothetical protein
MKDSRWAIPGHLHVRCQCPFLFRQDFHQYREHQLWESWTLKFLIYVRTSLATVTGLTDPCMFDAWLKYRYSQLLD